MTNVLIMMTSKVNCIIYYTCLFGGYLFMWIYNIYAVVEISSLMYHIIIEGMTLMTQTESRM